LVESARGGPVELPRADCSRVTRSRFGEDLVGGWLRKTCGPAIQLQRGVRIDIPIGGLAINRRADWVLDGRIIVEVKSYATRLGQGGEAKDTHQIDDFARWRDFGIPKRKRALVLARVSWSGNADIDELFRFALAHFGVPILTFKW
jgi:hypothetical protein